MSFFLSSCGDRCGWIAASVAALAWGSFGVPIKHVPGVRPSSSSSSSSAASSATAMAVDVNPLVMQSYKTLVCFVTSFGVVLLGERLQWSNWGLASGLFWVPGATCGVYGIRQAGLAVAVGTWSSLIVLTSFFFGIVLFHESVKDLHATCCAFFLLALGLMGMARFSMMESSSNSNASSTSNAPSSASPGIELERLLIKPAADDDEVLIMGAGKVGGNRAKVIPDNDHDNNDNDNNNDGYDDVDLVKRAHSHKEQKRIVMILGGCGGRCRGVSFTQRQLGILGAVINGSWGGMNLIPLHYAKQYDGLSGAAYVVSFGGGAMIVNTAMWILLYLYYWWWQRRSWRDALECLPKWHLRQLGYRGLLAGVLYSIGNFSSIVAVSLLGQATGYSACQMQLLVSGLWGVFFFKEIKSTEAIAKWFLSAGTALLGIIWLAYQHEGGESSH